MSDSESIVIKKCIIIISYSNKALDAYNWETNSHSNIKLTYYYDVFVCIENADGFTLPLIMCQ